MNQTSCCINASRYNYNFEYLARAIRGIFSKQFNLSQNLKHDLPEFSALYFFLVFTGPVFKCVYNVYIYYIFL